MNTLIPHTHISLHMNASKWTWASGVQNVKGWSPWPDSEKTNFKFAIAISNWVYNGSDGKTLAAILCESKTNLVVYTNIPLLIYMRVYSTFYMF
jgi:hypothetical protein